MGMSKNQTQYIYLQKFFQNFFVSFGGNARIGFMQPAYTGISSIACGRPQTEFLQIFPAEHLQKLACIGESPLTLFYFQKSTDSFGKISDFFTENILA